MCWGVGKMWESVGEDEEKFGGLGSGKLESGGWGRRIWGWGFGVGGVVVVVVGSEELGSRRLELGGWSRGS